MNRAELVMAIAEKTGNTKSSSDNMLRALVDTISDALADGDKVQLVGFGTFETRKKSARKGRNPQTGEEMKIPASIAPAFKSGKSLKAKVNN